MAKKISILKQRHYITRHSERIRSSDIISSIFKNSAYVSTRDPSLIAVKGSIGGIDCIILNAPLVFTQSVL